MTKDKERDDALIAEKKKLSDVLEAITRLGTVDPWRDDLLRAAALLRGDEQPKPDRYVVALREVSAEMTTQEPLKDEFIKGDRDKDEWFQAAVAVLREHFPERPAVVVPNEVLRHAHHVTDNRIKYDRSTGICAQFILSLDGAKGWAATSIDVHQRRGIMATCITLALRDYDEWQKDDDYNFIAALERVINHLEPAREVALQEFSQ